MYNNTFELFGKNTFFHFSLSPSTSDLYPSLPSLIYFVVVSSLVAQTVEHLPAMWETQVRSLSQKDPLEKELATHSSILAWKIPWTEEPGGLQSMGSQRVGLDWHYYYYWLFLWQIRY